MTGNVPITNYVCASVLIHKDFPQQTSRNIYILLPINREIRYVINMAKQNLIAHIYYGIKEKMISVEGRKFLINVGSVCIKYLAIDSIVNYFA